MTPDRSACVDPATRSTNAPSVANVPGLSVTRRSCMSSAAKLASFDCRATSTCCRARRRRRCRSPARARSRRRRPSGAEVAPRPPQPEPRRVRAHHCSSDVGLAARRWPVGHDPAARQLDHPVGDPRDLPVVGHDQHGHPGSRLLLEHLEDLDAGRKSSSPVGSSASRIGLPVARARAMATRCCSPPDSWCGKWSPGRRARPGRARRPLGGVRRRAAVGAELTFSSAVSPGNRLKLWKMKLTRCGGTRLRSTATRRSDRRRRPRSIPTSACRARR